MKKWLEDRLSELGKSKAELGRHLKLPHARITEIINGKREIKSLEIAPLANFLNWEPNQLLSLLINPNQKPTDKNSIPVRHIRVEGVSQAGIFKDISLIEDDEFERKDIPVPFNSKYAHAHQYALLVAGDSMNNQFKDGSYVACASWGDLGLELKSGMILHVERIKAASMVETTIKTYTERDGKRWLAPDSSNKKHLPIEINGNEDTEIHIKGAVIGSYVEYEL